MRADRREKMLPGDQHGVAIVLVLMLILAGGALAHGALLTARGELSAARARAEGVERAAAERHALENALIEGDFTGARDIGAWSIWVVPNPTVDMQVTVQRIAPESWWASVPGSRGRRPGSPGTLLWWMDAASRVRALDGVVSVGADAPLSVRGAVYRLGWNNAEPPLTAAICQAEASASGEAPERLARLDSAVVRPPLGLLQFDTILVRTPTLVDGGGTPGPVQWAGECVTDDAWNWGDPERPGWPCGAYLSVRAAASNLRVVGGVGQGTWVIDGDLVLAEGARLFGFILTSGTLALEDGATFEGAAIAVGGFRSDAGTQVRGSACWAERALAAAARTWAPRPEVVPNLPTIMP